MSFVNKVQFEMAGAGMYRILYDVIPKDISTANKIFFSRGFPKKQPSLESSGMNLEKYYSQCMSYGNINKIQPLSITHCLFNDSIVENNSLYSLFYNRIRCGSNSAFVLYNNEELNFESYFEVVSVFRQATIDLMEDYSFSIFAKHYNELENDQMKIVDEQIPARFFEFSPEALEYLRNKGLLNSK